MKNYKNLDERATSAQSQKALARKLQARHKRLRLNPVVPYLKTDPVWQTEKNGLISGFRKPNLYKVLLADTEIETRPSARMRQQNDINLVVGDRVVLDAEGQIDGYLERFSSLSRMRIATAARGTKLATYSPHLIASNIDYALIVVAAAQPDFAPGIIDRYLVFCHEGNVKPLVCINKCDLVDSLPPIVQWYQTHLNLEIMPVSTQSGQGLEELKNKIAGKTIVVVGHSGVGKSSIIKAISGNQAIRTQQVSEKGQQGQHTTTTSNVYQLAEQTYIIDTPGVRTLSCAGIDRNKLKSYFGEFSPFEADCKHRGCLHDKEQDCGVKVALEQDPVLKTRYQSYLRMLAETQNRVF